MLICDFLKQMYFLIAIFSFLQNDIVTKAKTHLGLGSKLSERGKAINEQCPGKRHFIASKSNSNDEFITSSQVHQSVEQ